MTATRRPVGEWLTARGELRVPEITAMFWLIKGLSTAMGESTSDYLVHAMAPELAVVLGFLGFAGALVLQFRMGRYVAWTYWLAVVMVGIFGTMAADVVHVALGVPYTASTVFYALVLAAVFSAWRATEHTLSIHSIDTPRREAFYWATVAATFAMGTALGDFTAYTLKLGYFPSALVFAALIAIPAIGYRWLRWNGVLCFWMAYVVTRPLGASLADGAAKPKNVSGLGIGAVWVVLGLGTLIAVLVAYLTVTKIDVQRVAEVE
ncbi:MAG TPA: hypothetical protein VGI06_16210 [Acidimicrobiales bacterium]